MHVLYLIKKKLNINFKIIFKYTKLITQIILIRQYRINIFKEIFEKQIKTLKNGIFNI